MRFDPALIAGIAREITSRWEGRRVGSLALHRDPREAWLAFPEAQGPDRALGFLLHPTRGYVVGADRVPSSPTGNVREIAFRRLYLGGAWAPPDQRLLVLDLGPRSAAGSDRDPAFQLVVELHTNQWNAIHVRGGSQRIEAVLWPRTAGGRVLRPGVVYASPEGARRWSDELPTAAEWSELLASVAHGARRDLLLRSVAWTSSLNVDWILGGAAGTDPRDDPEDSLNRYLAIRAASGPGDGGWLVGPGGTQPYPVRLTADAPPAGGLLRAMTEAARPWATPSPGSDAEGDKAAREVDAESRHLERRLRKRIRSLERRRAALERQLDGESPDELRERGHLLLARQAEVPKGAKGATLEGFDGEPVSIDLDPRRDAVQNAEIYYDRARRRDRAARSIPPRIERTTAALTGLQLALDTLAETGPTEEIRALVGGEQAPASRGGREEEALPYRRYRSSGGLEIRVGRSARGNDELTFRHSAPEDVWLHARQAAGAHVILRWGRREQNPPHRDLSEAAILAATFSESRHSGTVAVDWTRRKYVRKPRKAAAGAVLPERVSTLFVTPNPDLASRLDPEA
jgi:predicted ribosome quality control (RQC) complex YloA/Tae2 family protein